jgi:hypothetical protein
MEKTGKAYAFFDCSASKEQIEAELPKIRECVRTPSNLELSLAEGVDRLKGDKRIMALAKEAKDSGMKYVLEAKYEGATNKQTADEVASVLNQAYQSPLYAYKEEFRGNVLYNGSKGYVALG